MRAEIRHCAISSDDAIFRLRKKLEDYATAVQNAEKELGKAIAEQKKRIRDQEEVVQREFDAALQRHQVRSTLVRLAILLPLVV